MVRVLPASCPSEGRRADGGDGAWRMRPLRGQERTEGRGMEGTSLLMRRVGDESKSGDLAWLPFPLTYRPPSVWRGAILGDFPRGPACTERPTGKKKPRQGRGEVA